MKKENKVLKAQIEDLSQKIESLQENCRKEYNHESRHLVEASSSQSLDPDTTKSLDFLGNGFEDLMSFRNNAINEITVIKGKLQTLSEAVSKVSSALDDLQQYSFAFNVKLLNVQELNTRETVLDTSQLCVSIFKAIGANVNLQDIGIAHRVSPRNPSSKPKPIVCKFTRRLTREEVMSKRKKL